MQSLAPENNTKLPSFEEVAREASAGFGAGPSDLKDRMDAQFTLEKSPLQEKKTTPRTTPKDFDADDVFANGMCCMCGEACNPLSQACGACMRRF